MFPVCNSTVNRIHILVNLWSDSWAIVEQWLTGTVAQWLGCCAGDSVKAATVGSTPCEATMGSTPGQDRVKDFFFKSSESHLVQTVQCLSHLHMLATHWRCAGDPVKAAALGSTPCRATVGPTPGQNRVKDPFLALRSHTLCRLFSACLTFTCSPHTGAVLVIQ